MALEQETRLSFNVPAKWSNRFSGVAMAHGFRIAFAEAAPGETQAYDFHTAVIMTRNDAKALVEMINDLLRRSPEADHA